MGCALLAMCGAMYASTGLLTGPGDVALGMSALATGLCGLAFAKWREYR